MDLNVIAPLVEQIVKDTLRQRRYPFGRKITGVGNKIASSNLVNSVKVLPVKNGDQETLEIDIAAYGNFVDDGRQPGKKMVPISAITQWLTEKGIGIRDERGRFVKGHGKTRQSHKTAKKEGGILPIAFAIQRNIQKFGIRSAGFVQASLENIQNNDKIINLLEQQSMNELLNIINTKFNTTE
ncbi:hypothetical protein UFOVP187_43 [uncultured Caudovirales phage]|uniref:Uncharacterized protein n=1 Tax=uncultured Caudovirales phage TaxID=2100421 RepID=A0A6J7WFE0_9CAUD|nr:hypothetical protein UFOVP187_43 [uncultured Caudovirales phage]